MLGFWFPSGRRGETTGVPPESFSGVWGNRGLASPRAAPVGVLQDTAAFLSGVFSKSDRFRVTNTSGGPVLSWRATGERQLMSDSGGLSERAEARRFPLPLTRMCERERERHETLLSRTTCETSVRLCELFGLLESCSPELRSGRILHSRIEGGCECECDDRRLGDCERDDCDLRPDSQRRVRSCEGGGGIPGGASYFFERSENQPCAHMSSRLRCVRTCTTESYKPRSLYGERR
jgi:hypothetical protein